MSQTTFVSKILAAASSTSIGSISSAGVVTLSCATLDTARRITVVGASLLGPTLTIGGLNQAGNFITEVVPTSTLTPGSGTTTQDFLKVTSVTLSCALGSSGGALLGTNTQGGTPWATVDTIPNPTALSFNIQITSPSTVTAASFEYSFDPPVYNPATNSWSAGSPTAGPRAIISSLGSTATSSGTTGQINFPISAWRVTVTSTSSSAGSVLTSVLQSGN